MAFMTEYVSYACIHTSMHALAYVHRRRKFTAKDVGM